MAQAPWRGVALALAVGMSFATGTSLAALAYAGGASPLAVLIARAATALFLLFLLLHRDGVSWRLPPRRRSGALALGLVFASYSYGVLVAVKTLPVGLVVGTFYCFPILVALVEWSQGRHPLDLRTVLALVLAFAGVALAVDAFGGKPLREGMGACLFGALAVTVVMTQSPRLRGDGDSRPVTLHLLAVALVVYVLLGVVLGDVTVPTGGRAWLAFLGAPLFYSFGIITLFVVVGTIGPVRMSLLMNIEPVTSVVLGYLLLGQVLALRQLTGIALVIAAVVLVQSGGLVARRARPCATVAATREEQASTAGE